MRWKGRPVIRWRDLVGEDARRRHSDCLPITPLLPPGPAPRSLSVDLNAHQREAGRVRLILDRPRAPAALPPSRWLPPHSRGGVLSVLGYIIRKTSYPPPLGGNQPFKALDQGRMDAARSRADDPSLITSDAKAAEPRASSQTSISRNHQRRISRTDLLSR